MQFIRKWKLTFQRNGPEGPFRASALCPQPGPHLGIAPSGSVMRPKLCGHCRNQGLHT